MSREVIIYGIRAVGTTEIRYVGQTVDLTQRRRIGYSGPIGEWQSSREWEYVELDRVTIEDAVAAERRAIGELKARGVELLNVATPQRSRAGLNEGPVLASGRTIRAPKEAWALWETAAEARGMTVNEWIRASLDALAAFQLAAAKEPLS